MDESSDSTKRPPDDPPPPPTKLRAMVNPSAQAYAQNIALQAEIQGIREEMQKQAKQAQIAQEVQNRLIAANTNPRTEIIRELQTIIQPAIPLPQAPAQHNELMTAFEQAMANQNHALGKTLERMGMSMAEFVEHLKDKDKKQAEPADGEAAPEGLAIRDDVCLHAKGLLSALGVDAEAGVHLCGKGEEEGRG